jgi:hypothetical protein
MGANPIGNGREKPACGLIFTASPRLLSIGGEALTLKKIDHRQERRIF